MSKGINIAAIILNHCDNQNTLRLASVMAQEEIVTAIMIVDNSGVHGLNGSEAELQSDKINFMVITNEGYARGNNLGIREIEKRYGHQDFIVISNPDVEVSGESIRLCLQFLLENEDCALTSPQVLRPSGELNHLTGWKERTFLCDFAYSSGVLSRLIGMYRETYPKDYFKTPFSTVDCASGSFFMIRGSVFKQVGYFDENTFLFYEEDILGFKIKRLGKKECVLNTCSIIHREGVSAGRNINYLKKYMTMQKSRLYFHRCYKKTGIIKYSLLCVATGIGYIENLIKQIIYNKN